MFDLSALPDPDFHVPHVAPLPTGISLRKWLAEVRRNMLTAIPETAYRLPVVSRRIGPVRWHVLGSPQAYRRVFKENLDNYPKAPIMQRMLAPYLGQSLFMAHGDDWALQRRAMAPVFRPDALAQMADDMVIVAERTADRLQALGHGQSPVQISFQMRVLATEMVRHTMFKDLANTVQPKQGAPHPDHLGDYRAHLQTDLDRHLQRFGRPGLPELLNIPDWALPGRWWKKEPTAEARQLVSQLIQKRRASGQKRGDLLDMLLDLRMPETNAPMPDDQIRDNLMTFIVTGSDTTALALTWSIYVLTQQPEWAAALRAEADEAIKADEPLAAPDQLPLLNAFLQEVLRLFPSAPLLIRKAAQGDEFCGANVRSGDLILAPVYALHRNPQLWKDPHLFDPTRFLGPRSQDRWSYLPFGAGPRSCIGAGYALLEARLALATFIRRLDFRLTPGWKVKPLMMLTLKPDGGLPVHVQRRQNPARTEPKVSPVQAQPSEACSAAGACSLTNAQI